MINFFEEDKSSNILEYTKYQQWLEMVISNEKYILKNLNYIFCSDEYLLKLNKTYLLHDYYTDVLTFDNSDSQNEIDGDIYISICRVYENAKKYKFQFDEELKRILIHGLLHLLGYDDKDSSSKKIMKNKETFYINKFSLL